MRGAEAVVPDMVGELVAAHPMRSMASEKEVASAVLWLCSPGAGCVTGAAIAVDGGFLAA
jgi:NAD(P)-dependent dehydrogenase (short-subunit alcohol dehydrogenase family)